MQNEKGVEMKSVNFGTCCSLTEQLAGFCVLYFPILLRDHFSLPLTADCSNHSSPFHIIRTEQDEYYLLGLCLSDVIAFCISKVNLTEKYSKH